MWARPRTALPDDRVTRACALTYLSDMGWAFNSVPGHSGIGGPSLDHAVWFHRSVPVNQWMLLDLLPVSVAGRAGRMSERSTTARARWLPRSRRRPSYVSHAEACVCCSSVRAGAGRFVRVGSSFGAGSRRYTSLTPRVHDPHGGAGQRQGLVHGSVRVLDLAQGQDLRGCSGRRVGDEPGRGQLDGAGIRPHRRASPERRSWAQSSSRPTTRSSAMRSMERS